ncbi:glycoside hydrolase family 6 protein [Frankia sp. AvcI1]|uniref:glycoside hydrolase family 6 protein n=1 Tax=Frankia sp. AvcI1 TaxID=573496 RepID=UPI000ABD5024|nr:glycoside hydrolase family 6 protein [Frankia sp. AvcI1]
MSDASGHRRHRRPTPGVGRVPAAAGAARGHHGRFFALLWPFAALMVCAGFGLEQLVIEPAYGSSGGSSTVAAQPGIITLTPAPAPAAPTLASSGPVPGAKVGVALAPAARATRPVASASPAVTVVGPTVAGAGGSGTPTGAAALPAVVAATAGDPFAAATLYVDPAGDAAQAVRTLRQSDPAGAQTLSRLADRSHADWFGDPDPATVRTRVADRVRVVRAAGALPVLVAYAIPQRDCGGGQSAGGVGGESAYRAWIAAFAAGIGSGPAAVILEPDALAQIDCLAPAAATARYAMLGYAVDQLAAVGAEVYLDAGNASWHSVADTAARLRQAGVARARGFALNVSNFDETADETAYGDAVVAALGGTAHYVVDTSRNGRGPAADNAWCNPPGRGLGVAPSGRTGNPRADAYLWIKVPGESDGACNGGPAAGGWWLDYALGLASRAA